MASSDEESDFEGFESQQPNEDVDVNRMLTNIFGDSDDNEEFDGFAETEIANESSDLAALTEKKSISGVKEERQVNRMVAENAQNLLDQDEGYPLLEEKDDGFMNDFDRIMESKKELMRRRKRKHDTSYLSDNDDAIADIVRRMQEVAEEDRELVRLRQPAVKKLVMLPVVIDLLIKAHLRPAMIENNILKSIMLWLSPLPDNSLPSLKVRQALLDQLLDFPPLDEDILKESGIGKAVMYLRKHPKEIVSIKQKCAKLIDTWSRVIFKQNTDYMSLSRDERMRRDKEHLEKRRKTGEQHSTRDLSRDLDSEDRPLRPGDPGFVARARVPQPSNRDYLVRPEWRVKTPLGIDSKDQGHFVDANPQAVKTRQFDKHFRSMKSRVMKSRQKGGSLSLEGRRLSL